MWGVRRIGNRDDVLLTASYWGLRLMRLQGRDWVMAEDVKGADISAKTFYIEDGLPVVWVANKEKGIFRLTLTDDLTEVKSRKCYNSELLPKGDNVCITRFDGETVVASRQGLLRYDAAHDSLVLFTELEDRLEGHVPYTYLLQNASGDIWYAADGTLHLVRGSRNDGYLNDWLMEDFENVSLNGDQAIIGSIAARNPERMLAWLHAFGKRIILGADVRDGRVAVSGWLEDSGLGLDELVARFLPAGLERAIVTDITRDGMLQGPSFGLYTGLKERFPALHLIVSGGVSCLDDIRRADEYGLAGIIVGKALYEQRINLKDLEKCLQNESFPAST